MDISIKKRQKYITNKYYVELEDVYRGEFSRILVELGRMESGRCNASSHFRWSLASGGLELLILNYTAGQPIAELREQFFSVIKNYDDLSQYRISMGNVIHLKKDVGSLDIFNIDAYVCVFWLLALCKLFGHDEYLHKVVEWVNCTLEQNDRRDGLLDAVVRQLTTSNIQSPRLLLHPAPYWPLASATICAPEKRPGLVKAFVDSWYNGMKDAYWYGTHVDGRYFGYWCFEAALVTVLWDIDDSSFRDNPVYPRDLVAFARQLPTAS
ncbi:PoNe immunity protein domain-containing protein [Burkholderia theae]|uniref:PoNe immunity protein domain-containing protein n=1 Tax=Burkholderia theae TaxID=3143496 RepID=UPI003AFB6453